MAQENKKITQLPEVTIPSLSGFTIFDDGLSTSKLTIENLASVINTDVQSQLDGKQNLLFITDQTPLSFSGTAGQILVSDGTGFTFDNKLSIRSTGNTEDVSFIGVDPATANINIISISETAEINIGSETPSGTDNIIIDENGLTIENVLSGQTTSINLNNGIEISFENQKIVINNSGFYIENPNRIDFPTSVITGDTIARLSDVAGVTEHWLENKTLEVESTDTLVISGDYVLDNANLIVKSSNKQYSAGVLNFKKEGQIFIGGNLLLVNSNITNNGKISVSGGLILSGTSTITGTGIII